MSPLDGVFPLGYPDVIDRSRINSGSATRLGRLGVDSSSLILLFVGTFGLTYDLSTVIDAARHLENEGCRHVQFVLCGDGDQFSTWRMRSAGLRNVVFTGWLDRDAVGDLLRAADIGLMAYARDAPQGLPNKMFEYMAAGLPMLSSLRGEGGQLIVDHSLGYMYDPGDVQGLVTGIRRLLDEERRREIGDRCARLFSLRYRADIVYEALAVHLESAAVTARAKRE